MRQPTYPIDTDRLFLRLYQHSDLDQLHDIHRRSDVVRYLYWTEKSHEQTKEMLDRRMQKTVFDPDSDGLILAVERKDTGELIGDISLFDYDKVNNQAEFGFIFHPDHQGRGFASEAARVGLDLAFDAFGLRRVIGRCDARNTASAKLMERLGLRREAHFREDEFFKGEWSSTYVYAILASEWN
ncbi:GNAT family protein [Fodinicola feengrottensis]